MDKIIIKYLSGTATEREKIILEKWLREKPENIEFFINIKHIFSVHSAPQKQVSDQETNEFMAQLMSRKPNQSNIRDNSHNKQQEQKKHQEQQEQHSINIKSRYYNFKRILITASGAAILILASALFFRMQTQINLYENDIAYMLEQSGPNYEYSTPFGVKGKVVLPDSTIVWLNSGSKISFPGKFNGMCREVFFSGEGFFEVKPNKETPMDIVLKSGLSVKVLGTKFNLSSYDNDSSFSLLLLSGKVNINNNKGKTLFSINPHEKITIDPIKNSVSLQKPLETLSTIGWKSGWLIFENAPLEEVFKKMERWYGQTIVVNDNSIYSKTLTAKFKEESVSQVFDLMNQISLINYQIKDSIAYISNYNKD